MYVFVRFTGIALLIFGLLFMLIGFVGAVVGFSMYGEVVGVVNNFLFGNSGYVLPQEAIRLYASAYGLVMFVLGMMTSAFGQLMLVFVDLAVNTRETNVLLRSLRRRDL